jgi:DNA-binding HxlR family transcriptional regulator
VLGRTYTNQNCSAARALEVVGERWSLLIIRDALFRGVTRFNDFQRSLGLAPNILATRLEGFVAAGLMSTRRYSERYSERDVDYLLTDKGRDLAPVILALMAWGDRWAAPEGPPLLFVHENCGGAVHQEERCQKCGVAPERSQVQPVPGPGAR